MFSTFYFKFISALNKPPAGINPRLRRMNNPAAQVPEIAVIPRLKDVYATTGLRLNNPTIPLGSSFLTPLCKLFLRPLTRLELYFDWMPLFA